MTGGGPSDRGRAGNRTRAPIALPLGRAGQSMPGPSARPRAWAKSGNARTRKVDPSLAAGRRTTRARRSRLPPAHASPPFTGWSGEAVTDSDALPGPSSATRSVRCAHERAPVGSRTRPPPRPTTLGGLPRAAGTAGPSGRRACTGRALRASGLSAPWGPAGPPGGRSPKVRVRDNP